MEFRKKTMATLFAAILIAMMGVMPALASTVVVPLTVDVVPLVSINVDPASVDFGTPRPGTIQYDTITIENDGDVAVTIVATVSGTFYETNLVVSGTYTSIAKGAFDDADLELTIPGDATGTYTGSITFVATG